MSHLDVEEPNSDARPTDVIRNPPAQGNVMAVRIL